MQVLAFGVFMLVIMVLEVAEPAQTKDGKVDEVRRRQCIHRHRHQLDKLKDLHLATLEALAVEEELEEGEHTKRDAAPQEIGQQEELGELYGGAGLLAYAPGDDDVFGHAEEEEQPQAHHDGLPHQRQEDE